jgi:hypothetical protein
VKGVERGEAKRESWRRRRAQRLATGEETGKRSCDACSSIGHYTKTCPELTPEQEQALGEAAKLLRLAEEAFRRGGLDVHCYARKRGT